MTRRLRALLLTAHIATSVGFLGAVSTFFALAVTGLTGHDAETVRAAYLAMKHTTSFVIVPLCFASLLIGTVQALATPWGLFRHYWVLVKFLLSSFSTIALLAHTQPIGQMAEVAVKTTLTEGGFHGVRMQLVVASGLAVLVLLLATALSVYKPQGLTRYGWRKKHGQ